MMRVGRGGEQLVPQVQWSATVRHGAPMWAQGVMLMAAMGRRIQVRAHIRGNVVATGMRSVLQREAQKSGVTGWVRADGEDALEAVFNGPEATVWSLVRWCERGPLGELVTGVDVEAMPREAFGGFDVRR